MGERWRRRCIVIDNASTDGTRALVTHQFPEVRVVRLDRNMGFGAAINLALDVSDADCVVVMNDDVLCLPGTLDKLVRGFAAPDVGMVAGVLLRASSGRVDTAGIYCDPSLAAHDLLGGALAEALPGLDAVPVAPSGGLAAYRRSAFDEVRGFDSGFFAYYEDLDLALRLRKHGWRVCLKADAIALHIGSATLGWRSKKKAELVGLSRGRMLAKYGVLRRPRAFPWLALEALGCIALAAELRSAAPVTARWRGYRDCGPREPYPGDLAIEQRSLVRGARSRLARRYAEVR